MKSLLVFGSINLDLNLRVPDLPRPGETVMASSLFLTPGGKGANQAHAASRYGARVHLVGAVGQDAFAEPAVALLRASGVELDAVCSVASADTGVATVHVSKTGENAIVVAAGANTTVRAEWVDDALIDACSVLLLQWEVPAAESMALARRFRARGGTVMLNLAPAHALQLVDPDCIDWLIVNQTELTMLCQLLGVTATTSELQVQSVAAAWTCSVVVTLGAAGAFACFVDGRQLRVPAAPIRAVDSTGAGDTFCGVLAAAMVLGEDLADALTSASLAASLSCTRVGAQAAQPTRDDVLNAKPIHPLLSIALSA